MPPHEVCGFEVGGPHPLSERGFGLSPIREVGCHLYKLGLPPEWATDKDGDNLWEDQGLIFLRKRGIIRMCVIDTRVSDKNFNGHRGPLTLETYETKEWKFLLNTDTPEDMANAIFTYIVTGVFDEV